MCCVESRQQDSGVLESQSWLLSTYPTLSHVLMQRDQEPADVVFILDFVRVGWGRLHEFEGRQGLSVDRTSSCWSHTTNAHAAHAVVFFEWCVSGEVSQAAWTRTRLPLFLAETLAMEVAADWQPNGSTTWRGRILPLRGQAWVTGVCSPLLTEESGISRWAFPGKDPRFYVGVHAGVEIPQNTALKKLFIWRNSSCHDASFLAHSSQ